MTVDKEAISEEIKKQIEDAASKEEIYEPKYGGKDHSGYDTMMKYEINDERYECFEKGAYFGYSLSNEAKDREIAELKEEVLEYSRNLKNAVDRCSKLTNDVYQSNKHLEYWKARCDEFIALRSFFKKGSPLTEMMDKIIDKQSLIE